MAAPAVNSGLFRRVRREQILLVATLLAVAAGAWLVTDWRMGGMTGDPIGELDEVGFYATAWVVMMAAMMLPSVWPFVTVYDLMRASHEQRRWTTAFVIAGYLLAWTLWGLAAFGVLRAGHAVFGDFLPWDGAGRWVAAGVVLAAAAYQLSPAKNACLGRCRGPLMFVTENWRPGWLGALRLGVVHGAWCVGCCWGLMATLFALGVMSVGWMAVIAALVAVEKLLPWRVAGMWFVVLVLSIVGLGLAVRPSAVPGISANDGGGAGTMQMQGMDR
jgi:predicted metal-binding membrane protein